MVGDYVKVSVFPIIHDLRVQIRKEPREVLEERRAQAKEANTAKLKVQEEKNEAKTKMKGKNKPSRVHKKKQSNIIEAKKVSLIIFQVIYNSHKLLAYSQLSERLLNSC